MQHATSIGSTSGECAEGAVTTTQPLIGRCLTWVVPQPPLAPRLVLCNDGHDVGRHAAHGADLNAADCLRQVRQRPQRRLLRQASEGVHHLQAGGSQVKTDMRCLHTNLSQARLSTIASMW